MIFTKMHTPHVETALNVPASQTQVSYFGVDLIAFA